jgi:hypothetical protein
MMPEAITTTRSIDQGCPSTDQVEMPGAAFVPECVKVHGSSLLSPHPTARASRHRAPHPFVRITGFTFGWIGSTTAFGAVVKNL